MKLTGLFDRRGVRGAIVETAADAGDGGREPAAARVSHRVTGRGRDARLIVASRLGQPHDDRRSFAVGRADANAAAE